MHPTIIALCLAALGAGGALVGALVIIHCVGHYGHAGDP